MSDEPTRNWGGVIFSLVFLGLAAWLIALIVENPAHLWWLGFVAVPLIQIGLVGAIQSGRKYLRDEKGRIIP